VVAMNLRTEVPDLELPQVELPNPATLGLFLGNVELPPELQTPREGERSFDGEVVLVKGKYRLRCDSGESLLLNPQSDGERLLGRRIRVFGAVTKG